MRLRPAGPHPPPPCLPRTRMHLRSSVHVAWSGAIAFFFVMLTPGRLPAAGAAEGPGAGAANAFPSGSVEFFETRVRPLLAGECIRCHGEKKQASELRLDSRASALAGGANGPALVPGRPGESLLIQAIRQ